MDDSLEYINSVFQSTGFHHVIVLERGALAGVISDRDILRHISPFLGKLSELPRDASTLQRKAHQIMTRRLITISPESSIADAAEVLLRNKVSCLPVVNSKGKLKGIITSKDLLLHVKRR